eukprot:COSAG03_NODE_16609_length_396_cov_1.471380_2_plen_41_part_01
MKHSVHTIVEMKCVAHLLRYNCIAIFKIDPSTGALSIAGHQ